ncbi:MAG: 1-deoxy-D-xylulose-5-phosphate synthase N-terminal domain-containing protein, partial [Bacillota bacterium]|nr:1-deoxy-D-xylulose-5-phosphate synthase N-terminal domain-containing protein [Bacillota bacterium]
MTILERINSGESIKDFNIDELEQLAVEIRKFLIEKVSENGGHLASNLGIVELTIALYYVFDFPEDKVVWDVGHQSYVHKILSGRMKEFDSLRKLGGLSGFPKTSESEYDSFNTGHASTSISAALGMAKARDLKGDKNNIIAVIGDGSLGGGMAYEAINDAGNSNTKMLVILNDNHMSISENVGAMSRYLNSIRISGKYVHFKQKVLTYLEKNDHKKLINILRKLKNSLKRALMSNTVFESLGLTYFGPFDGHDIKWLVKMLYRAKKVDKCVLFHVKTVKGKGYAPAEKQP